MSCIHAQRLESATIKMIANLWSLAPDVSMTPVETLPSRIIVNTGEQGDGREFTVNLYCGHSEEKVVLPAVVAYATPTGEDEPGNGLWNCQLNVQLAADTDSENGQDTAFNLLHRFSSWLGVALNATDLHVDITQAGGDLTVLGAWGRTAGITVENRRRTHEYSCQTLVSLWNL